MLCLIQLLQSIVFGHQEEIIVIRLFPQAITGINHLRYFFIKDAGFDIMLIKEGNDPAVLSGIKMIQGSDCP